MIVTSYKCDSVFQMEPIHEVVYIASRDNAVACTILIYYVLQAAKAKDALALVATLPVLAKCDTDIVYQDTVLHMLVSYLSQMAENFSHPEFADQILDIFFLVGIVLEIINCCGLQTKIMGMYVKQQQAEKNLAGQLARDIFLSVAYVPCVNIVRHFLVFSCVTF